MKTLRITVSSVDIARHEEKEFQIELTQRLKRAGFDLSEMNNIIRQERNDIYAVDFIQFQYRWWDRFDVFFETIAWKIYKWVKENL